MWLLPEEAWSLQAGEGGLSESLGAGGTLWEGTRWKEQPGKNLGLKECEKEW